jgi:predicted DNA binding CopG/RHH family protein
MTMPESELFVDLLRTLGAESSLGCSSGRRKVMIRQPAKQTRYLDEEERSLIESLENDEWVSVRDLPAAVATLKKDRRMNVRISERDLKGLKARAAEEGIPYQTLVTMILHKYVVGRLVEKSSPR